VRTIRWERNGVVREVKVENVDTALEVAGAIAAYWSGDGVKIQVWSGATLSREVVS
jgi:hypothetical protein